MILSLFAVALATPTVSVTGACPGTVDLDITGLTANGDVRMILAERLGNTPVPSGPCAGVLTEINGGSLLGMVVETADGAGEWSGSFPAAGAACGSFTHAIDLTTCEISPVQQLPYPGFDKDLGWNGSNRYSTADLVSTPAGGFIVATSDSSNARLVEVAADGRVRWSRTFTDYEYFTDLAWTAGGDLVIAAGDGTANNVLVFTDDEGVPLPSTYITTSQDLYAVEAAPTGEIYASGIWNFGMDSAGGLVWQRLFVGGGGNTNGMDLASDGTVLVTGEGQYGQVGDNYNAVVAKVDTAGNVVWNQILATDAYDWSADVTELPDGRVAVTGWSGDPVSGRNNGFLALLTSDGVLLWSVQMTNTAGQTMFREVDAMAGGLIVGGQHEGNGLLARFEYDGSLTWARDLGVGEVWGITEANDGGIGAVMYGQSSAVRVLKTNAMGESPCSAVISPSVVSVSYATGPNSTNTTGTSTAFSGTAGSTVLSDVGLDTCP